MTLRDVLLEARDAITVKRVFGDPYEKDGITLIPAASIRSGMGGRAGASQTETGPGWGGAMGVNARPVGAYVIKNGSVTWQPAVDVNRIVFGGQVLAIVFLLALRAFLKAMARR